MHVTIIIMLILAILLVIFTLQNSFEVSISVFFWEIPNAPLVLVLLVSILLGYILSAVYFYPRIWNLKKKLHQSVHSEKKMASKLNQREMESNPEGIELDVDDDEDDDHDFFRDQ
jgi:lipopolysaccharide assembly protein A